MSANPNQTTRLLTLQYMLALSIIALLIIIGYIFVQALIDHQTDYAYIVNTVGRQRMFSQQLSKDVLIILTEGNIEHRDQYINEVSVSFSIWSSVHISLNTDGAELNSLIEPNEEITNLFTAIEPHYQAIYESVECVLSLYNQINTDLICDAELENYISIILAHEKEYLEAVDGIVFELEIEATRDLQELIQIEFVVMSTSLLTLTLEATFIFRPAINRIKNTLAELLTIQNNLSKTNETLQLQITERKLIEETLASERNILRAFIDNVPDLIVVKDRDERFLISNLAHAEAAGVIPEEIIGKTAFDIYSQELATQFHTDDERILRFGESLISQEREILMANGQSKWVLTTKRPLHNPDGEIWGLVSISRDITERRQAELALQVAFEKEKELGKLKDRFMAMASHEFRTPLAVIKSSSQMLQRYTETMSTEKRDKHLRRVDQQIKHLSDMIENIALITKTSDNPLEATYCWIDLEALCKEIVDSFANSIGSEHVITLSTEDDLANILADEKLLQIVVSNLLSNAIKYSQKGTEICLDIKQRGNERILCVSDQGIGIQQEHIKHLFDAYYRVDNTGKIKGIGLGLKIVKDFVELHNGRIDVESVVDKGTTFTIYISAKPYLMGSSQQLHE